MKLTGNKVYDYLISKAKKGEIPVSFKDILIETKLDHDILIKELDELSNNGRTGEFPHRNFIDIDRNTYDVIYVYMGD